MTETSFDLLLWRSLLPGLPPVPDAEDQIDWADRCVAAGLHDAARMMYETAFVRQGFSAEQRLRQAQVVARAGLADMPAPTIGDRHAGGTLEMAVGELEQLARAISHRLPAGGAGAPLADIAGRDPQQQAPSGDGGTPPDMAEIVHRLYLFLQGGSPMAEAADAERFLQQTWNATSRLAEVDHRRFFDAPLPLLAAAVGVVALRDFMLSSQDLMFAPLGSAELLQRVARLGSSGLGPYFRNVAQLARRSRDVFDLAEIAIRAGEAAGARDVARETWVVLLSRELRGALLDEVVDDLGDLGAMPALWLMFDRASRRVAREIDLNLILRLRDAALDNGDYELGARAQGLVARMRPNEALERVILGSIQASGGDFGGAEHTFLDCLRVAPEDADVRQRLRAARAGSFDPFKIGHGFGTPQDRLIVRLRRRDGERSGPRVTGKRTAAVEFY